ncbi:hypothetical protein LRD17_12970, partial [Halorhodospira halochloris]|nr:hypothetical protein [Halorhodospira halochloris]
MRASAGLGEVSDNEAIGTRSGEVGAISRRGCGPRCRDGAIYLSSELHSLVHALFRLEHSRTPDDMRSIVATLSKWLVKP